MTVFRAASKRQFSMPVGQFGQFLTEQLYIYILHLECTCIVIVISRNSHIFLSVLSYVLGQLWDSRAMVDTKIS
jgi:hypothetical protein